MPSTARKTATSKRKTPTPAAANSSSSSAASTPTSSNRPRKRRRIQKDSRSKHNVEPDLGDCKVDDVKEIDRRLRKVARENAISSEDMHKVVRSVVRNDHVLALVTLKAEDEMAREKREAEQQHGAIIITDTPSVAKLTRAKARELNRTPGIILPPLNNDSPLPNEMEALINAELHSDEDDEEYTFKEDDFHSDDDPSTAASDFDSNPCTPQTPLTANEADDSPIKFSADGCFKMPLDKQPSEDLRIAARTRSKLCLQQTTIEDLQSEFVPPDVEQCDVPDYDMTANDEDWMQFLNDFSKPLNNNFLGDDDDPINDPEYVAAEKVTVDAEELRDVNISKKELTDLVSELFEGLLQEGISLESIELETPQKFLLSNQLTYTEQTQTPTHAVEQVTRQIDFDAQPSIPPADISQVTHSEMNSFHPDVMSTPSSNNLVTVAIAEPHHTLDNSLETVIADTPCKIVSIPSTSLLQQPELIAVPLPGQPNCFQLAKVIATGDGFNHSQVMPSQQPVELNKSDEQPYDVNFGWEYINISKHLFSEYASRFESLRNLKPTPIPAPSRIKGFTLDQHDMLQQQLRLHTQMLTQSFLQTYSHPVLYTMAKQPKEMLHDLHKKAAKDASFNCWNLQGAIELIGKWEHDLSSDEFEAENKKMMAFINKEIELTDGRTRQVPRLPPRIMELMLDSTVFMYPQYLPRIAFQPKTLAWTVYAPTEYQLIAMGLEKHLTAIRNAKKPLGKNAQPLRIACKRMAKDMLHGKQGKRIIFKVNELRATQDYNPVKYYFDHERAPPIYQQLLLFEGGVVRTPRERYSELPSGWKYYMKKIWSNDKRQRRRNLQAAKASEQASASYLEFVREAVGEDLLLPENFCEAAVPHGSSTGLVQATARGQSAPLTAPPTTTAIEKSVTQRSKQNRRRTDAAHSSLTINVNYVFGGGAASHIPGAGVSIPFQHGNFADNVVTINRSLNTSNECSLLALPPPPPPLADDAGPAIHYNYDSSTQSLQITELENSAEQQPVPVQELPAEPEELPAIEATTVSEQPIVTTKSACLAKRARFSIFKPKVSTQKKRQATPAKATPIKASIATPPRCRYHLLRHRLRHKLQKRCQTLLASYGSYLQQQHRRYGHVEAVQLCHRRVHALELYTQLLADLSMFCRSKLPVSATVTSPSSSKSAAQQQKRQRSSLNSTNGVEDESSSFVGVARNRKANRQEEMLRHMLQPDAAEESNRKDATFAFNFYDKVEEALLAANRVEDCQKFNQLLQTFDPKQDKVADLYLKVEKLLLPDNPELAEVFLNFLLPAEAAELGKFFEHFMITNATSFINKLNIYFCKQPAQIKKIYACLSELAELPNVSIKKVESKILPLLKGNQFLCDWFLQQFPQAKPPERLLPTPEALNLHEVQSNVTGEFTETVNELLESPPQEQPPSCQLKYLNGRIFYGSKIMLPAKLSFMAASIYNEQIHDDPVPGDKVRTDCVHGIRVQGDKLISQAAAADSDNERSEEDDVSRALIIDTTADEENSCSSMEICDDVALRAHAVRLNSGIYGSNCFSGAATSTPNVSGMHQAHHPHAKKTSINFGEMSPRKQSQPQALNHSPMAGLSLLPTLSNAATGAQTPPQDKRRSPNKKIRSPLSQTTSRPPRFNIQPMVVIHDQAAVNVHTEPKSPAIECAKRLKTLIDQESAREELDNKANIIIIAKAKQPAPGNVIAPPAITKAEADAQDEDLEFLPEGAPNVELSLSQQSFPAIRMQSEDELEPLSVSECETPQHVITTQFDSDEDCKLDVVATLVNFAQQDEAATNATQNVTAPASATSSTSSAQTIAPGGNSTAWTREEDKVILIEMKMGARDREHLIKRMRVKLKHRNVAELRARHQFLMDFLSKLQGKM